MVKGIDVSTLQGNVNWSAVRRDGVDFAMIKATQGRGYGALTKQLRAFGDSKFAKNIAGATGAGIKCGVYHFFTATTEADAEYEANYFLAKIRPHEPQIDLWAAIDVEGGYLLGLSRSALTGLVKRFLDIVESAGYSPMLYINPDFLINRVNASEFTDVPIWLAHYGVSKPYSGVNPTIWQYGAGRVNGVGTECDLNYGYFDLPLEPDSGYIVGGKYTIRPGDVYTTGQPVPKRIIGKQYTIAQVREHDILLREINSRVKI